MRCINITSVFDTRFKFINILTTKMYTSFVLAPDCNASSTRIDTIICDLWVTARPYAKPPPGAGLFAVLLEESFLAGVAGAAGET